MRVLVGHPSPSVADGLAAALRDELQLSPVTAGTLADCRLRIAEQRPTLAVVDVAVAPDHEVALCDLLVADGVRPLMMTHGGSVHHLALLEHGAAGIVVSSDGLSGVLAGVRTVLEGHVHIPPHLLGTVLHDLILAHRSEAPAPSDRLDSLSPREREVLGLLGGGADTREIAARLVISPHTAKTHINRVLGKLGLTSRTEAATFAVHHGILPTLIETGGQP